VNVLATNLDYVSATSLFTVGSLLLFPMKSTQSEDRYSIDSMTGCSVQ
jgi:hypothetical protein